MFDYIAPCDYQLQIPQCPQIFQRILRSNDKIRCLAFLNGAGQMPDTGQLGAALGGGVEGEGVGDTHIFVEIIELSPEVLLGNPGTAHVVAENHRNIVGQGRLSAVDDTLEDHISVVLLHLGGVGDGAIK